jgi:hypothetical protein
MQVKECAQERFLERVLGVLAVSRDSQRGVEHLGRRALNEFTESAPIATPGCGQQALFLPDPCGFG